MKIYHYPACIVMLLLAAWTTAAHSQWPNKAAIAQMLQQRVETYGPNVGMVVGLVDAHGRQIVAHGLTRRGGMPVDGQTFFEIGSVTKTFTALLLADMVERGQLHLHDELAGLLPPDVPPPITQGRAITLMHLVTHTSGLPRMPTNISTEDIEQAYATYMPEQMYAFLGQFAPTRPAGARYEYSNYATGLLGHVLARRAHMPYKDLLRQRITGPLDMPHTLIEIESAQEAQWAQGHNWLGEPAPAIKLPALQGAGALRSTAEDLLQYLSAQLGLIDSPLWTSMQRTQIQRAQTGNPDLSVGLGWHIQKRHGSKIIVHGGGTWGFRTFVGFDRERRRGVVVLANVAMPVGDLGLHLLEPRYELAQGQKPNNRQAAAIDPALYDDYQGYYKLSDEWALFFYRAADTLYLKPYGPTPSLRARFEMVPKTETDFFLKVAQTEFTFVRNRLGKITQVVVRAGDLEYEAERAETFEVPQQRLVVSLKPSMLAAYSGQYQLDSGSALDIKLKEDALYVQMEEQRPYRLLPSSETEFFLLETEAAIAFVRDAAGKVRHLVLRQQGEHQARKVEGQ